MVDTADAEAREPVRGRRYRPLGAPSLLIFIAVAILIVAAFGWWMWTIGDAASTPRPAASPEATDLRVRQAQLRIDIVRNILTAAAGTGGLLALILALRRQFVNERVELAQHLHREADLAHRLDVAEFQRAHAERTAEASENDSHEKRIVELYVKAAEQLGSTKALVRLAGLHALERLAQANAAERSMVVNVICAYLRMPFDEQDTEEPQVRSTAQEVLRAHTTRGAGWWPGTRLLLSGAVLVDFVLDGAVVDEADFRNARFVATASSSPDTQRSIRIAGTTIHGVADFTGARFEAEAILTGNLFQGRVLFDRTTFAGDAYFGSTDFGAEVFATGAVFEERASFISARFAYPAFGSTRFDHPPDLEEATVRADADGSHSSGWPHAWTTGAAGPDGYAPLRRQ